MCSEPSDDVGSVMVVGMLLTLVACVLTWRSPGVYWASTKVYFLVPATVLKPNQLAPDSSAAIGFAGIVMTEINGGPQPRNAISPDVTLVDQGIYDGWSVLLPDTGGQWADNFTESTLIVQASGPTAEIVRTRMNGLIDEITRLVVQREDPPTSRLRHGSISPCRPRWSPCNTPTDIAVEPSRSSSLGVRRESGCMRVRRPCRPDTSPEGGSG